MNIGIVGHEAKKFTMQTEEMAREIIRFLIQTTPDPVVVSGRSPLGGIDIWAEEEAGALNVPTLIFPAKHNTWNGSGPLLPGFKFRNELIAHNSAIVHCIVVADYHAEYSGMRFLGGPDGSTPVCYHCKGRIPTHVKSGGCWTAWQCPNHQWWIL